MKQWRFRLTSFFRELGFPLMGMRLEVPTFLCIHGDWEFRVFVWLGNWEFRSVTEKVVIRV